MKQAVQGVNCPVRALHIQGGVVLRAAFTVNFQYSGLGKELQVEVLQGPAVL